MSDATIINDPKAQRRRQRDAPIATAVPARVRSSDFVRWDRAHFGVPVSSVVQATV